VNDECVTGRPSDGSASTYDRHYRAGGFGYEADRRRWASWVREHYIRAFDLPPGGRLLDIPCGDGFWSSTFRDAGFKVTGLDLSEGGIEVARSRYPGIRFAIANAEEKLPVDLDGFDVVFSRAITHLHRRELITESSTRMIRNLMRYVAPGGVLLLSYNTKRDGSMDSAGTKVDHPISQLVALCERAGEVTRVELDIPDPPDHGVIT